MTLLQAIIMGVIQGLAEFLPISSSGHLAIFKNVFHVELDTGMMFDVLLHVGTLIAVFICFWSDIRKMIVEGFKILGDCFANIGILFSNPFRKERKKYHRIVSGSYRKFVILVLVSTIPTGILGYLGKDLVEAAGENMLIIGVCLLITAFLLFICDRAVPGRKTQKNISYPNAFGIGIAQGIATLPGISRSGMTITAGVLSGFDRKFAVKYSFIMSIPAICGAVVLDVKDMVSSDIPSQEWMYYLIGMLIAAVIGFLCIKFVLVLTRNRKFKYFGFYCILMGLLSILYYYNII